MKIREFASWVVASGRRIMLGALLILAVPLASGCGGSSVAVATAPAQGKAQPVELTEGALKNASYDLPDMGVVQLQDGTFELKLGPGATQVNKAGYQTAGFGDLNGDGAKDAAVVLWTNTGGSGTYIYLVAMQNQNGAPRQVAATRLGDREKIGKVTIADGKISVGMTTFGPTDPKCCPSVQVTKVYQLQGSALKQVS